MINKKDAKCWAELKSTEAGLDGSVYQRYFKDGFVSGIEYLQNISLKDRYEAVCLEYIKLFCEKQEVFNSFGVKRGTEVYLKNGDTVDKENVYKVTGFSRSKEELILILHKEAGEGKTLDEVRIKSKTEFQLITKE